MNSMDPAIDNYLTKSYYTKKNPASYSGPVKLWNHIKSDPGKPLDLNFKMLKKWYDLQDTHNIHKIPVKRFKRESIIVEYMDQEWDADLITLNDLKRYNDGYSYILACIDLFSRFVWCVSLKVKSGEEVMAAFKSIFSKGRKCEILRTDRGGEFVNNTVKSYFKEIGVYQIFTYNELHANYIERWNRTLQNKMYKYFYEHQTLRYIDVLQDFVVSYNSTTHSTINMAPKDVTEANARDIYERIYIPILEKSSGQKLQYKFSIGDIVRLTYNVKAFQRGYKEHYTEELFKIVRRIPSYPPRYKLVDMMDEEITGSFYEQEMLKVLLENNVEYKIDRVISKKKIGGVLHALVSWYGYPEKFRSYVPVSQLKDYSGK